MKLDQSEVIATSNDLCDAKQNLLIVNDDKYIVVNQNKKVAIYSMKTGKYVTDILQSQVIQTIWSQNPDDDFIFALACIENNFSVLKVKVPSGKIVKTIKCGTNLHLDKDTIQIQIQHDQENEIERVYFVKEVTGNKTLRLVSQNAVSAKTLSFGQIQLDNFKRPLMAFNSEIVVRIVPTVSGKPGDSIQVSSASGTNLWSTKCDKERPITSVKCSPKGKIFATGDKSGRIRVWKDKNVYSEAHWHSLPVEALEFSLDGVNLYSGGHEGVIVKWDIKSMQKVALVPRIGTTLCQIVCTFEKVIAVTANNFVKIFTTHLEDVSSIAGLTKNSNLALGQILHHPTTNCLVFPGSHQTLQFFDPIEKRQKFALEVISENVVLGERGSEKVKQSNLKLFDIFNNKIATIEESWDNVYIMKIWNFQDNAFKLNTSIREVHMSKVNSVKFISDEMILTCGQDGFARLWQFHEKSWSLAKAFNYLKLHPICGISSQDKTVLAISFGLVVVLYDLKTLQILSALVSKKITDPCTSLAFGLGHNGIRLLVANIKGVFIWDMITLRLIALLNVEKANLHLTDNLLILTTKDGIYKIDATLSTKKIASGLDESKGLAYDKRNQRLYFVSVANSNNVLKYLSLNKVENPVKVKPELNNEEDDFGALGIKLNQLNVNVTEDIFHAKVEAPVLPEMITQKVSNCSEMIIKRMLPL